MITCTISVVVPVFNVRDYLIEALESVRNNVIQPDEVIVVDDGSTDGSSDILLKYQDLPHWQVVKTTNNGLGPARNFGRYLARSEYVYFFDSDDILDKNFVARMHEVIEEFDKPDLVMFAGKSFYDDGFDHPFSPAYQRTLSGKFTEKDQLITELVGRGEAWAQSCLFLSKKDLWSKNRLSYPPILHEDEAVLFPLLALSKKTIVLPDVYFHRRIRQGSIMTSGIDARNVSGVLRVLNETMEFMAREPHLVKADITAWRARIAQFGARYLTLCRKTGTSISWAPIFASVIAARQLKYLLRLAYVFLPESMQKLLRFFRNTLRKS